MRKYIYLLLSLVTLASCNFSNSLLVTPAQQEVSAEGGQFVVSLTTSSSDLSWSAKCDSSWVTLSQSYGRGDAKITVTAASNPHKIKRSAIIRIEDKESVVQVVVTQLPNTKSDPGGTGENEEEEDEPDDTPYFLIKGKKIVFAPGNLQYNAAKDEWRFAENQWDYIDYDNSYISSTYDGWIDLFGWATSGYSGCYPYLTSLTDSEYGPNELCDLEGDDANYDWGVYNSSKISNTPGKSFKWRLLASNEWMNLKENYLYTLANIEDYPGLLIFGNQEDAKPFELSHTDFYAVTIDEEWLASHHAVFLPAAGVREGTTVERNTIGEYHTSTSHVDYGCVFFEFEEVEEGDYLGCAYAIGVPESRHFGAAVRLVREVK